MAVECCECMNEIIISEDILSFSKELFYCIELLDKNINPDKPENEEPYKFCTKNILKAAHVTFISFHKYIKFFYGPLFCKRHTKKICLDWLDFRKNVFVKVLDTIAFAIGIYKKLLEVETIEVSLLEASKWFCEMFQQNLSNEFFREGGWCKLDKLSEVYYAELYNHFTHQVKSNFLDNSVFSLEFYDCVVIDCIKNSPVFFPLPKGMGCAECQPIFVNFVKHKIVYMMTENEYTEFEEKIIELDKTLDDETMDEILNEENLDDESEIQRHSGLIVTCYAQSTCSTFVEFEMGKLFIKELKKIIAQGEPQTKKYYATTAVNLVSGHYTDSFDVFVKKTYLEHLDTDITDLPCLKTHFRKILRSSLLCSSQTQALSQNEDQVVPERNFPISEIKFKHWMLEFYLVGEPAIE